MKTIEGKLITENAKFCLVAGRFNEFITQKLIGGAVDALERHGAKSDDITLVWVPGAFEIPTIAKQVAKLNRYDAIICLGAVIKGSTPHFDYVSNEVSKGVAHVALEYDVPVIFGVLTTNTIEEAIERAGTKAGNKGFDAAVTAIEMVNLMKQL